MTMLRVGHHGGHKVCHTVFVVGNNIAKYMDMPQGARLAAIRNS
jgi:hypothetical protein